MGCIISIDLGTTKICAAAVDVATLKPLAVVSCVNDADVMGISAEFHEQCPQQIWTHVERLIRRLVAENPSVGSAAALSISGQMHGVMLVDEKLSPIGNFMTWRDRRGCGCEYENATARRTGCRLHPGYGGATLAWLAKHGEIPSGSKALSLADFIAAKFSGVVANENTHAASWGIFDIHANCWDANLTRQFGIPHDVLCEVKKSATQLGKIKKTVAAELGLPESLIICSPVGDNQASVIGAGGFDTKSLVLNLGTGGQVSIPDCTGNFIEGFETRPMPGGGFIHVGASLCGGWSYAYLKNFCGDLIKRVAGVELSDSDLYAKINQLAAGAAQNNSGLSVDTRFAGVRGKSSIRGQINGIDTANFNISNLAYAFLEGMVGELKNMAMPMLSEKKRVVASGNAVRKNPLMPAIITKVFGMECAVSVSHEEAAIGAAAAAALELGLLTPADINSCLRNA